MAEVVIDASIDTVGNQGNNSPRCVWVTQAIGYAFYQDANGDIVYSKTTDGGATWGAAVQVASAQDYMSVAVWFDRWTPGDLGNLIHIAYMGTGTDKLFYRNLNVSSDTFGTEVAVATLGGVAATSMFASITKCSGGHLYVAAGANTLDVWHSDDGGSSWASTGATFLDDPTDEVQLLPRTADDVMLIYLDQSATDLLSRIFSHSGGTWGSAVTIDSAFNKSGTANQKRAWGGFIDRRNLDVYLAGSNNPGQIGNDVKAYKFNGTSWSTLTDVVTDLGANGASAKMAVDHSGNLFCIYSDGLLATGAVYYKKSTDGGATWGSQTQISSNAATYRIVFAAPTNPRIYGTYVDNGAADLLGNTIEIPPIAVIVNDSITATEFVSLQYAEPNVIVFDSISIVEAVTIARGHAVDVFDSISVAEFNNQFLDVLNVDVLDPFHVLITETVDIIDLIVEVGVVMEPINPLESVGLSLDQLFLFAFDAVSITEDSVISVLLEISVFESLSVVENNGQFLDVLNIDVFDAATVAEDATLMVVLLVDVFDSAAIAENAEVFLDALFIDVFDSMSVAESVNLHDIIIELGIVFDTVSVSENLGINLDVLNLEVSDNLSAAEFAAILLPILNANVFDAVSVAEFTAGEIAIFLSVFDAVSVIEAVTVTDIVIELGMVFDAVSVVENRTLSLDALFVERFDSVAITESATALRPFNNVSVFDSASVAEFADASVVFFLNVFDSITVVESASAILPILNFSVFDLSSMTDIPITEFGFLSLDQVQVNGALFDNVGVADVAQVILVSLVEVFDSATITEAAFVVDITIELGIIFDQISIAEFVSIFYPVLGAIGTDLISILEFFNPNLEIKISVSDQFVHLESVLILNSKAEFEPIIFEVVPRVRFFNILKDSQLLTR